MTTVASTIKDKDLIVSRGKYKDQDVTNLMNDTSYVNWLLEQKTDSSIGLLKHFKDQAPVVYNIIVNSCAPKNGSSTPEHNNLQNKFMKPDFIDNFLKLYWDEPHHHVLFCQGKSYSIMEAINLSINRAGFHFHKFTADWQFETFYNWDVRLYNVGIILCDDEGKEYKYDDDDTYNKIKKLIRDANTLSDLFKSYNSSKDANEREEPGFVDYHGGRVNLREIPFGLGNANGVNFLIEIKPDVGDDYPEILRKISNQAKNMYLTRTGYDSKNGCEYIIRKPVIGPENCRKWNKVLVLSNFQSKSVSFDELKQIFKNSNVAVYKSAEITSNQHQLCNTSSP